MSQLAVVDEAEMLQYKIKKLFAHQRILNLEIVE